MLEPGPFIPLDLVPIAVGWSVGVLVSKLYNRPSTLRQGLIAAFVLLVIIVSLWLPWPAAVRAFVLPPLQFAVAFLGMVNVRKSGGQPNLNR